MDDSTRPAVLDEVQADLIALLDWLGTAAGLDLSAAEQGVRDGVVAIGARLLEAGMAARGTGKAGGRGAGAGGGAAACWGGSSERGADARRLGDGAPGLLRLSGLWAWRRSA